MSEEFGLSAEWLKSNLLPWLPPVFTLVGWFIVNRQNNQREARKEARSAADRCKVLVREVAQYGIEYWNGTGDIKSWKIRASFEELEVEIGRFQDRATQDHLLTLQAELVDAVMGHNFDTASFKPVAPDHPVFKEIPAARQRLLVAIEKELARQFH